jgi:D-beta-D-heptose 7-phosphate kinase/D-beta-D-heptose 1-phosphate adenosyltransferase
MALSVPASAVGVNFDGPQARPMVPCHDRPQGRPETPRRPRRDLDVAETLGLDELIELIDRWRPRRALVLGDYMLDRSMYGNVDRLTPDAPVPVLAIQREENNAGGAANVCFQLAALRCEVRCAGVTGPDEQGRLLRQHLAGAGCDVSGLVATADRPTIVKQSFIGLAEHRHPQKMFRADYERTGPLPAEIESQLLATLHRLLAAVDVLCVQDHDKGLVTEALCQKLISSAREHGVPVLIDPALLSDYGRYRGATLITPNRFEAANAVGRVKEVDSEQAWREIAQELAERFALDAVIITLDRHGALLLERGSEPVHLPTAARSVYDVRGAGDMMLAALAASLANGAPLAAALRLANVAAGMQVERFGVVPIGLEEIHLTLLRAQPGHRGKERSLEQILPELAAYRKLGHRIAFTNGCFDLLHAGHVDLLRKAKQTADLLVLAVNTDRSIRALKGPRRPIVSERERLAVLAALEAVDYLVLFGDGSGGDGDTPRALIEAIRPDVLVKGGDYTLDTIVGAQIVQSYGGRVETIALVEGLSTSNIVERIRAAR